MIHDAVQPPSAASCRRATRFVTGSTDGAGAWRVLRDEVRDAGPEQLWRYTADMLYLVENPVVREASSPAALSHSLWSRLPHGTCLPSSSSPSGTTAKWSSI